ncbi:flavin reductase family protein [Streptomyces atratus]|uniref:flavin reductase family protein n=1 Tax=Streptomyces atratus TaxID=1893 RepID=UPI0033CEBC24
MTVLEQSCEPYLAGEFGESMSTFRTGLTIVAAVNGADRAHCLTCASLTSVTLTPSTLPVYLNAASGTWPRCCGAARSW